MLAMAERAVPGSLRLQSSPFLALRSTVPGPEPGRYLSSWEAMTSRTYQSLDCVMGVGSAGRGLEAAIRHMGDRSLIRGSIMST